MKILVISGYSPNKNSSANLSHNAFVEGFIRLGYKVDVLCHYFDSKNDDNEITVPDFNRIYTYDGLSFYEKLSAKKNSGVQINTEVTSIGNNNSIGKEGIKTRTIQKIKDLYN